jgi:hypothetical protein
MNPSRRKALLLGGSLGTTALSGCASLPMVGPELTLKLMNFTPERRFLELELFRADGSERSESVALHETFEIPSPSGGDGARVLEKPDVVESQRYLVRAELDGHWASDHYHFYPDCAGDENLADELYVEIHRESDDGDLFIEFQQTLCSNDSWWY